MAQKVLVQLIDDLDGTPTDDVSTVEFGLDGATYEIDLSDSNAQRLRDALADYVGSAHRVGGRIKRGTKPHSGRDTNDAAQVREWANANGHRGEGQTQTGSSKLTGLGSSLGCSDGCAA